MGSVLLMVLIFGFAIKSGAFLQKSQTKRLSLSGRKLQANRISARYEKASQERLKRFRDDNSTEWMGLWNSWGTLHRLYPLNPGRSLRLKERRVTEEEVKSLAITLIKEYSDYLKVTPEDLVFSETITRGGIIYCRFRQLYRGINVYG